MIRHPRAMETASGRSRWSSFRRWAGVPTAPLFEQIDFHRQLADLALEFRDLALVLGDVHRLGQLVGKLASFVLADPKPNQIERQTVPARQLMQAGPAVE